MISLCHLRCEVPMPRAESESHKSHPGVAMLAVLSLSGILMAGCAGPEKSGATPTSRKCDRAASSDCAGVLKSNDSRSGIACDRLGRET